MYLQELTVGLLCSRARWSDRSRGAMALLADAMLGEARGIARNRYENTLVHPWMRGYLKHVYWEHPWKYHDVDVAQRAKIAK